MLVLSSPSGAGKSTISRALLENHEQLTMSVSATTRPQRPGEIEGKDYFFVDQETFEEMIAAGEFLEQATVFGNSYGTPRGPVMAALEAGQDVLFDVDWQGTQQLRQNALEDLVSIFILPPSLEELERRLFSRNQDSEQVVRSRMSRAYAEMSHWAEYDYIIINEEIEDSVKTAESILAAERARRERQRNLGDFVRSMDVAARS
ncbi:MAG: guanylate kinase [Rhodospirillaceae bacterium]|nr:guanylate kinase [Rhodospirillaceae bacterium]